MCIDTFDDRPCLSCTCLSELIIARRRNEVFNLIFKSHISIDRLTSWIQLQTFLLLVIVNSWQTVCSKQVASNEFYYKLLSDLSTKSLTHFHIVFPSFFFVCSISILTNDRKSLFILDWRLDCMRRECLLRWIQDDCKQCRKNWWCENECANNVCYCVIQARTNDWITLVLISVIVGKTISVWKLYSPFFHRWKIAILWSLERKKNRARHQHKSSSSSSKWQLKMEKPTRALKRFH